MAVFDQRRETKYLKRLRKAYFLHVDAKEWDHWRTLFTDDCTFDATPLARPPIHIEGGENFVEYVRDYLRDARSIHTGQLRSIVFLDQDHAAGLWSMTDCLRFAGSSRFGSGYYDDTYRREDGIWRISSVRLTYLWSSDETQPPPQSVRSVEARAQL